MSRTGRRAEQAAASSYVASEPSRGRSRRAGRMLAAAVFFLAVGALDVLAVLASTRSEPGGRSTVWVALVVSTAASMVLWGALLRRWWTRRPSSREPSGRASWVRVAAPVGAGLGVLLAQVLSGAGAAVLAGFVAGLALVAAASFGWLAYRILSGRPFAPAPADGRPRS